MSCPFEILPHHSYQLQLCTLQLTQRLEFYFMKIFKNCYLEKPSILILIKSYFTLSMLAVVQRLHCLVNVASMYILEKHEKGGVPL